MIGAEVKEMIECGDDDSEEDGFCKALTSVSQLLPCLCEALSACAALGELVHEFKSVRWLATTG